MSKYRKIKDERIEKANDKINAIMYIFMATMLLVLLGVKVVRGVSLERYIIEILCLAISGIYMVVSMGKHSIKLFEKDDVALKEVKTKILSKCGMICFWIVIMGEFVLLLGGYLHTIDVLFYIIIWGIPALCITFYSIKNGLLIWDGNKRKALGKKALATRTAIGALIYGIVMGGPKLYNTGTLHTSGLFWIIGMALGWGIPFYFIYSFMVNRGE